MITLSYIEEIDKFTYKDGFASHRIGCFAFSKKYIVDILKDVPNFSKVIEKIPPAFSIGGVIPQTPILQIFFQIPPEGIPMGIIAIEEDFQKLFNYEEIKFILAHEYSHIIKNHSPLNALGKLGSQFIKSIIQSIDDPNWRDPIYSIFETLRVFFKVKFQKDFEIDADLHAVELINNRAIAVRTIEKLANIFAEGDLDKPTHVIIENNSVIPVVTFRDRLNALHS